MVRVVYRLLTACAMLVAGCGPPGGEAPLEGVRIGDIAPAAGSDPGSLELVKSISVEVTVIEVPLENRQAVADLRRSLDPRPVRFTDAEAFASNAMSVSFGRPGDAAAVLDMLEKAAARDTKTSSLLFTDERPGEVVIRRLPRPCAVRLPGAGRLTEDTAVGPGALALRVRVERVPGSAGLCSLSAVFVYLPRSAGRPGREVVLYSTAFGIMMKPGRFLVIGPVNYKPGGTRLGDILCGRPGRRPAVAVLMLSL
jgi:hypothetical protein